MNEMQFSALLGLAIVPKTVELIVDNSGMSEIDATNAFYTSKTYKYLSDETTKVWHYSPLTLYHVWKQEVETGEVDFPEEGLL